MTRPAMLRRAEATQATFERFKGKPFELGKNDCAKLVSFHLRGIGRPIKVSAAGPYKTLLGAKRALKRLGFYTLEQAMDATFERIPPAAAVVGDVISMPGMEGPGSLAVALGGGRVLAYHEDAAGAVVVQPSKMIAAWMVV